MSRNVVLIVAILLSFSINLPSSAVAMPTDTFTILPEDCKVLAGKEVSLTLDGAIPPDTTIQWEASDGGITSMLRGSEAIFIAPFKSALVTISVFLSPAIPGVENPVTRQCVVTSPNSAPDGMAQAGEMAIASTLGFPTY